MKLRFTGTGFGECRVKKQTVKEYRRPASLLIDDRVIIDPSPALFEFEQTFGLDRLSAGITDVLITHSHPGHFSPEALASLAKTHPVNVYASREVIVRCPATVGLHLVPMVPGEMYDVADYKVIALPAGHRSDIAGETCFNFAICRDRSLFYAVDGGFPAIDAWEILRELSFDAVVCECALGFAPPSAEYYRHQSMETVASCLAVWRAAGTVKEGARVVLSHLPTDKKSPLADLLSQEAAKFGATAAYDGYFLTV